MEFGALDRSIVAAYEVSEDRAAADDRLVRGSGVDTGEVHVASSTCDEDIRNHIVR